MTSKLFLVSSQGDQEQPWKLVRSYCSEFAYCVFVVVFVSWIIGKLGWDLQIVWGYWAGKTIGLVTIVIFIYIYIFLFICICIYIYIFFFYF